MKKYLVIANRTVIHNGLVNHFHLMMGRHATLMGAVSAMMALAKDSGTEKDAEIISKGELYATFMDTKSNAIVNVRFLIEEEEGLV